MSSSPRDDRDEPDAAAPGEGELSRRAGLRDVVLGAILLAMAPGPVPADPTDLFFDALGFALLAWGLYRVVAGHPAAPARALQREAS